MDNLARGLAARGHRVKVLCCRFADAPLREEAESVEIIRVPATYVLDRRYNGPTRFGIRLGFSHPCVERLRTPT